MSNDLSEYTLVIGAGLSGVFSALESGKKRKVLVIEQADRLVPESSSSFNECYKLHTGLHYAGDSPTALKILEASVAFARSIPSDCIAGGDLKNPCRRGRHFVMSNSLFPAEKVKEIAIQAQKRYQELVIQDPKNKVFGEPENFIKFLEKSDYPDVAKNIPFYGCDEKAKLYARVVLGIETAESQIDIGKLRKYLEQKIAENKNIAIKLNTKVHKIAFLDHQIGYSVTVEGRHKKFDTYQVSAVINCSWQNIEKIDKTIGFYVPDENRVIRVKMCINVKLPPELHGMNTCIFSIGPYVSFTNLGNGEAVLASEITTNVGFYRAGDECPATLSEFTRYPLSPHVGFGKHLGEKIREECAQYFDNPELLRSAPIQRIMVGHVKLMHIDEAYTRDSLFKQKSPIHQREAEGIEVRDLCYISVSGNKMSFTRQNAILANEVLDQHFAWLNTLNDLIKMARPKMIKAFKEYGKNNSQLTDSILYITCKKILFSEMQNFCSTPVEPNRLKYLLNQVIKTIQQKELVLSMIKFSALKKKSSVEQESCELENQSQVRSKL